MGTLARTNSWVQIAKLLPAVDPEEIFCIGLNYMKHWEEAAKPNGIPVPPKPFPFMKPKSSIIGPGDQIWMPQVPHGEQLDWEVELGFVIGKSCRNVKAADALSYVAG